MIILNIRQEASCEGGCYGSGWRGAVERGGGLDRDAAVVPRLQQEIAHGAAR